MKLYQASIVSRDYLQEHMILQAYNNYMKLYQASTVSRDYLQEHMILQAY